MILFDLFVPRSPLYKFGRIYFVFLEDLFGKEFFFILLDLFVPHSPLYKFGKIYFVFLEDLWENPGIQVGR